MAVLLGLTATACGPSEDVIVKTADGVSLTAADIDREPMALLPAGAAMVGVLDAPQLFSSAVGQRLLGITRARVPLPPSAGFEPSRDLQRLYFGVYSFQGADFAGVAQGHFNKQAIEAAADGTQNTPLGTPLVRVEYAGRVFYVSGNLGFVVLTESTAIFGNETGIRRALDRLEAGRVKNELPPQLATLMRSPGAPMAFGLDLVSTPQAQALEPHLPFIKGLQIGRVVGNFDPPGLNLAGTLTYPSPETAEAGRANVLAFEQQLASFAWLASVFGYGKPIERLDVATNQSSVQFVIALNDRVAGAALDRIAGLFGTNP